MVSLIGIVPPLIIALMTLMFSSRTSRTRDTSPARTESATAADEQGFLDADVSESSLRMKIERRGEVVALAGTGIRQLSLPIGSYQVYVTGGEVPRDEVLLVEAGVRRTLITGSAGRPEDEGAGKRHATPVPDQIDSPLTPLLVTNTGPSSVIRTLTFSPGGDYLFAGGEDKVVFMCDFREDHPKLARTLRPPIWRGPAGTIYAMALTRPDARDNRSWRWGDTGLKARRGDLTIFRVPGVERWPGGAGRIPTGEIVARLLSPPENQPKQIGHRNSVLCLAFDPSGRVLASGSKDTTAILWDVPAFRPRAVLRGTPVGSASGIQPGRTAAGHRQRRWIPAALERGEWYAGGHPGGKSSAAAAHQHTGVQSRWPVDRGRP